jgi:DNA-binding response OmpR family regulator
LLDVEPNAVSVLLVEDDDVLRALLALHLRAANCTVRECASGDEALAACEQSLPTTLVLDVMLPGRSGLELCALVRAKFDPSPGVVMLTARGEEADVIAGFSAGADDYVIKPCRPREVVARVQALARRLQPARPAPQRICRGAITIDVAARIAFVSGAPLKLTGTEFALLHYLARSHDVAFSRMQLLRDVFDSELEAYARNVDCHITRLRRKLESAGLHPSPIETVHGVGYRFSSPEGE